MKPVQHGPFLGLNNRRPRSRLLVADKGAFLADAVNVDFNADGFASTRQGFAQLVGGTDVHSLWGEYFVDGGSLKRLSGSVSVPLTAVVLSGLTPNRSMSYTQHGGQTFASNGDAIWRLSGGTAEPASVPIPAVPPELYPVSGSLPEGWYQVSVVHVSSTGEMSPATPPVQIWIDANGGIELRHIPQLPGYDTLVFASGANGRTLYRTGYQSGTGYLITLLPDQGERLYTLNKAALPPGEIIRSQWGRLLIASGNLLYYSDPWSVLYDPLTNFVQFEDEVTLVEPCGTDGCFIAAGGNTFWLPDPTSQASVLRKVFPCGAVRGTSGQVPDGTGKRAYWMSTRGLVIGTADGQVASLQEDSVAVEPAAIGAAIYRERDGIKQLLASTFNSQGTSAAASTFADAEVIHTRSTP